MFHILIVYITVKYNFVILIYIGIILMYIPVINKYNNGINIKYWSNFIISYKFLRIFLLWIRAKKPPRDILVKVHFPFTEVLNKNQRNRTKNRIFNIALPSESQLRPVKCLRFNEEEMYFEKWRKPLNKICFLYLFSLKQKD